MPRVGGNGDRGETKDRGGEDRCSEIREAVLLPAIFRRSATAVAES